jgi:hypothetical protein
MPTRVSRDQRDSRMIFLLFLDLLINLKSKNSIVQIYLVHYLLGSNEYTLALSPHKLYIQISI